MTRSEETPESAAYSNWKGWGTKVPFGLLEAGDTEYFTKELREVTRRAAPIRDVLEIGFGNGAFLEYCRSRGWNVAGTELGPELVTSGKEAGFNVYPSESLSEVPNGSFDLIAAFDVLEHIPQTDIVDFLSILSTKLRAGGMILLRFPNADSWLGNPIQHGDPTHVTAIGYFKMTYFALQSNLDIVAFRGATRHGFATSFLHGMYSVIAGPIIGLIASLKRALYFPGIPVVLSTSNVICVVRPHEGDVR